MSAESISADISGFVMLMIKKNLASVGYFTHDDDDANV